MATLKTGYHHGDLRSALIDAGLHLTRTGGPEALTIREATRRVGVSPNAAYRHFVDREALLSAVASAIQHRMAARMQGPARRQASDRLRAVGLGYIKFALDEPGWFTVAFFGADPVGLTTRLPAHHRIWRWSRRSMQWSTPEHSRPIAALAPSGRAGQRCTASLNSRCAGRCVMPVAATSTHWPRARSTTSSPGFLR